MSKGWLLLTCFFAAMCLFLFVAAVYIFYVVITDLLVLNSVGMIIYIIILVMLLIGGVMGFTSYECFKKYRNH